jgi:acyl carrier protein
METRKKVREFIAVNFYVAQGQGLADGTSLLESGIVDSTGVLEVIGWLEKEFGITVEDREMISANLDSIDNIVDYVTRKISAQGSGPGGAVPSAGGR